jgi:transcriptional regulator with XRE-family HTH domain
VKTNNKIAPDSLAVRIKRLRIARGLTQRQLATSIGISKTAVMNWESGVFPRGRYLPKLAEALGVDLGELMVPTMNADELTEEVQLIAAFRVLPKERQLIAIKLLEALKLTGN